MSTKIDQNVATDTIQTAPTQEVEVPQRQTSLKPLVSDYLSRSQRFYEEISNGNIKKAYINNLKDLETDLNKISVVRQIKPIVNITDGNLNFYSDLQNVGVSEAYKNHWNRMKDNAKKIPFVQKGLTLITKHKQHCEEFYQNFSQKGIVQSYLDHWKYMFNFYFNK